jgi:hypothetical protein
VKSPCMGVKEVHPMPPAPPPPLALLTPPLPGFLLLCVSHLIIEGQRKS